MFVMYLLSFHAFLRIGEIPRWANWN